jgi:hypothetical protein
LFVSGMLSVNFSGRSDGTPERVDPNTYGADWSGPVPSNSCEDSEEFRVDDLPKSFG